MNKFLCDDTLILRPVEPSDADFMWEVESDSTQWVQNSLVAPFSKENLHQYACCYEADPFQAEQLRLIITSIAGDYVGIADLYELSSQHRTSMVGIYILPELRGKGLGMKSLEILENYASRILNLRQLGAKIVDGNDISMELFLKSGYEWSGTLKEWILSGKSSYSLHLLQKSL
ncbi:MAG: GNAT family N-acetyltransferase [Muribaculaceae bacterium]|nr:GNAT family N-acetyltransferase [Muribaculaceae bacterium]